MGIVAFLIEGPLYFWYAVLLVALAFVVTYFSIIFLKEEKNLVKDKRIGDRRASIV